MIDPVKGKTTNTSSTQIDKIQKRFPGYSITPSSRYGGSFTLVSNKGGGSFNLKSSVNKNYDQNADEKAIIAATNKIK